MRGTAFFYRHLPRLSFWLNRMTRANYEREMELLHVLCDPSRPGIDIGAKVGMYTYRIRAHSSNVIAFEPIPVFHEMLRAVFEGQGGQIEPFAVSNARGRAVLRMPFAPSGEEEFGRSTIEPANQLAHKKVGGVTELEIETRILDEYEFSDVGFIKVDVEGHEVSVLTGAARTIETHRPNMLIECNDEHQPNGVAMLSDWLDVHGYDALFVDGNQLLPIARYDRSEHWTKRGIENFICVHRSRADIVERVRNHVAAAKRTKDVERT